jgi:pimeloyl-ACP methyl ester carboxylesterase
MPQLTVNAIPLYYELVGPTEGEAVVFLSGLTGDHNNWTLQVNRLKNRYRCLTFDWRDTGNSGPSPVEQYSTLDMAGDVAGLIQGLGLGKSHLIGLSMGGAVAQEVALNYPEVVASLVLASTFCDRPMPVDVPVDKRTPGNLRQSAAVKLHTTCDRLHLITVPVLVVAGARDTSSTPESQYAYASGIPNARYELIQGAGHLLHLQKAGEFNRLVQAFLETHSINS